LIAACAALHAGCGKKEEAGASAPPPFKASTPQEFFESYQAAVARKDFATILNSAFSRAHRQEQVDAMKAMQEMARGNPRMAEKIKSELGVQGDPASLSAEDLLVASGKNEMEQDPREYTLVEVKEEGDGAKLQVEEKKSRTGKSRRSQWILVKEDGSWRLAAKM
jgi:hypothetical protein